jgi:hypothetical protein
MSTGFIPADFLFWRWWGHLAWVFPVVLIACFLISLRHEQFARATTLFGLATVQLAFITLYGVYCGFLLSHWLLERVA